MEISGKKKIVLTVKEIMEYDHPEIWNQASTIIEELARFQEKVVEMLPTCKKNLPKSFEELNEPKAQIYLSDYLRLRLLYAFARELWILIDKQCRELAENNYGEDSQTVLYNTLNKVSSYPFDDIANDSVTGLLRFDKMFINGLVVIAFKNWEFHDIIGSFNRCGLQNEQLWRDAVDDTLPTCSNIGELLADE